MTSEPGATPDPRALIKIIRSDGLPLWLTAEEIRRKEKQS